VCLSKLCVRIRMGPEGCFRDWRRFIEHLDGHGWSGKEVDRPYGSVRTFRTPVTILFLQSPRVHTSGVSGPKSQASSNRFTRAEEDVLGASFNTQSQVSDIPGVSSCAALSKYTVSLQAQSKDPDIHPLLASTEELLTSFNTQTKDQDIY
jgi:hypothetical protein